MKKGFLYTAGILLTLALLYLVTSGQTTRTFMTLETAQTVSGNKVFSGNLDLGATGLRITGSNGTITWLGLGDGADENLTLDMNTTLNTGVFTSSTSLTTLNFSSIALQESGIAVLNNDEIDASSELLAIMDDETGTGLLVFGTDPLFVGLRAGNGAAGGGWVDIVEDTDNGTNKIRFIAPAAITSDQTCTLENDGNPIPDSCVGDGTDASGGATVVAMIPQSVLNADNTAAQLIFNTNTEAKLGQVEIPFSITVNKITIRTGTTHTTNGTVDLTLYSEDGQTQYFSVTTPTITAANTLYSTTISAVALSPGIYYILANTNSTTDTTLHMWSAQNAPFSSTAGMAEDLAGEPMLQGRLTITAGTPPATFDPTALTGGETNDTLIFRLDN